MLILPLCFDNFTTICFCAFVHLFNRFETRNETIMQHLAVNKSNTTYSVKPRTSVVTTPKNGEAELLFSLSSS